MLANPTFEQVALDELRAKGITCRSCEYWTFDGCEINRPSFPRVCRSYEYMPGTDEGLENEEDQS